MNQSFHFSMSYVLLEPLKRYIVYRTQTATLLIGPHRPDDALCCKSNFHFELQYPLRERQCFTKHSHRSLSDLQPVSLAYAPVLLSFLLPLPLALCLAWHIFLFFFPWKESRRRDIVIQDIKYFFFLNYLFLRIRYNHPKGLLIRNFCPEAEELSFWMETHSMSKVSTENQMRTVATKENPGSSFRVPCWFFLDPLLVVLKRLSIF